MSENCCSTNQPFSDLAAVPLLNARDKNGQAKNAAGNLCPNCKQKGKKVDRLTVQAMLAVSLQALTEGDYLFCRTGDCPVVYFNAGSAQIFSKDQIRAPVHQKEPHNADAPVCYCFQHSPRSIQAEWAQTGQSTVVDSINQGIKAGKCACEIRNPQGSCCLGNVSKVVKQIQAAGGAVLA